MTKPAAQTPIHVVLGLDGEPFDGDSDCPICARLHADGMPAHSVGPDGELREARLPAPNGAISVRLRPANNVAAHFGTRPFVERVPSGTTASALAEYLVFFRPALFAELGDAHLILRRGRRHMSPSEELVDGDELVVALSWL